MQFISDKTLGEIETALGLDLLGEEERAKMMTKIVEIISGRAGLRIIKSFSDDEAKDFNKIPADNLEMMEKYIMEKNPEAGGIFEEEAQKIKTELLDIRL